MTTVADILRAAAHRPTPILWPEHLGSWVPDKNAYLAAVMLVDNESCGSLSLLTDEERRAFLILVAEMLDNPQEP